MKTPKPLIDETSLMTLVADLVFKSTLINKLSYDTEHTVHTVYGHISKTGPDLGAVNIHVAL